MVVLLIRKNPLCYYYYPVIHIVNGTNNKITVFPIFESKQLLLYLVIIVVASDELEIAIYLFQARGLLKGILIKITVLDRYWTFDLPATQSTTMS